MICITQPNHADNANIQTSEAEVEETNTGIEDFDPFGQIQLTKTKVDKNELEVRQIAQCIEVE